MQLSVWLVSCQPWLLSSNFGSRSSPAPSLALVTYTHSHRSMQLLFFIALYSRFYYSMLLSRICSFFSLLFYCLFGVKEYTQWTDTHAMREGALTQIHQCTTATFTLLSTLSTLGHTIWADGWRGSAEKRTEQPTEQRRLFTASCMAIGRKRAACVKVSKYVYACVKSGSSLANWMQ